jgi:hypothetical protein
MIALLAGFISSASLKFSLPLINGLNYRGLFGKEEDPDWNDDRVVNIVK